MCADQSLSGLLFVVTFLVSFAPVPLAAPHEPRPTTDSNSANESGLQRSTDVSYHAPLLKRFCRRHHTPVNTTQTGSGSGPKNCGFNSQRTEHGIICRTIDRLTKLIARKIHGGGRATTGVRITPETGDNRRTT